MPFSYAAVVYSALLLTKCCLLASAAGSKGNYYPRRKEVYKIEFLRKIDPDCIPWIEQHFKAKVATRAQLDVASAEGANWCGSSWGREVDDSQEEEGTDYLTDFVPMILPSCHEDCDKFVLQRDPVPNSKSNGIGPSLLLYGLKPERDEFQQCAHSCLESTAAIPCREEGVLPEGSQITSESEAFMTPEDTADDYGEATTELIHETTLVEHGCHAAVWQEVQCIENFEVTSTVDHHDHEDVDAVWALEALRWSQFENAVPKAWQKQRQEEEMLAEKSINTGSRGAYPSHEVMESLGSTFVFLVVTWCFLLLTFFFVTCYSSTEAGEGSRFENRLSFFRQRGAKQSNQPLSQKSERSWTSLNEEGFRPARKRTSTKFQADIEEGIRSR
mmetsp:Transcript_132387/g.300934  ORF Transcript_132387/g.300934 Transcript_132387/m.300934 type:complete len:387 (+) Transcript_132387:195-1355(+)